MNVFQMEFFVGTACHVAKVLKYMRSIAFDNREVSHLFSHLVW